MNPLWQSWVEESKERKSICKKKRKKKKRKRRKEKRRKEKRKKEKGLKGQISDWHVQAKSPHFYSSKWIPPFCVSPCGMFTWRSFVNSFFMSSSDVHSFVEIVSFLFVLLSYDIAQWIFFLLQRSGYLNSVRLLIPSSIPSHLDKRSLRMRMR